MDHVRGRVENWIRRCSGAEALKGYLEEGRLRVEVVGGVGVYGGWRFGVAEGGGGPAPLGWVGAGILHTVLRELVGGSFCGLEVDLTHGANYLPALFYRESVNAAKIYASARRIDGFRVRFWQSDPVLRGEGGPYHINVMEEAELSVPHVVEEEAIRLDKLLREGRVDTGKPRVFANTARGGERRRIGRMLDDYMKGLGHGFVERGVAAARVILYNMPLAAAYLALENRPPAGWTGPQDPLRGLVEAVERLRGEWLLRRAGLRGG